MVKEVFCVVAVLLSSIVPNDRVRTKVYNLVEDTFVVSETRDDNIRSQAVKVFGNSATLKEVVSK